MAAGIKAGMVVSLLPMKICKIVARSLDSSASLSFIVASLPLILSHQRSLYAIVIGTIQLRFSRRS